MGEAKQEHDWNLTCTVLSMINNVHATKASDCRDPDYFHPLRHLRRSRANKVQLDAKQSIAFLSSILVPK